MHISFLLIDTAITDRPMNDRPTKTNLLSHVISIVDSQTVSFNPKHVFIHEKYHTNIQHQ